MEKSTDILTWIILGLLLFFTTIALIIALIHITSIQYTYIPAVKLVANITYP